MAPSLLRAAFRVHWQAGLSAAMRVWTTLLVGIVVAMGLEAAPPLAQWSARWLAMEPWRRGALGAIASLAAAIAIGAVMRPILRGAASWPVRMLPLSRRERVAIDLSAAAAFAAVPAAAALLFAAMSGSPLAILCMVLSVSSVLTAVAGTLDSPRSIHRWLPACATMLAAATVTVPGAAFAAAILTLVLVWPGSPGPGHASFEQGPRSGLWRVRPLAPRPLAPPLAIRAELAWIRRLGARPILDGALLSLLVSLAAGLAIRNNDVERAWSAVRIAAFFAPFAVWAAGVPLVRLWVAARPWRSWEAMLPMGNGSIVAARTLVASPAALVPLAGSAVLWSHGWIALAVVALWIVSSALLIVPLMARAALEAPAMEAKGLWLAAACALAGALRPDAAIALVLALAPLLWLGLQRRLRSLDRPLPPLLELA